jgi:type II secretory pathway component PulJ
MRLHHKLLIHPRHGDGTGFSLVELLLAASLGGMLCIVAADAMIAHLRSSASLEGTERLRSDWSRTSHFIESEVALSERVLTNPESINLSQCAPAINAQTEFRFALEIRRDLPPAIYFVRDNSDDPEQQYGTAAAAYSAAGQALMKMATTPM